MRPFKRVPTFAGYIIIIVATMLSQCTCENNRKDDPHGTEPVATPPAGDTAPTLPPPGPPAKDVQELPDTLDTKDLDDDEKAVLVAVLAELYDPCGKSRSFLESITDPATCDAAKSLAKLAVTKVSQGLGKRQITRAILAEQARRARRVELDFNDVPYIGDPNAELVLVKFTDFECGYCKRYSQIAKDLAKQHGAVLYMKMLPLEANHPHARALALAALAAHKQGKFWEVYQRIFAQQGTVNTDNVRVAVKDVGLDMAKYDADVASEAVKKALERDLAEAKRFKLGGTPTFFVNGYEVKPEQLEAALAAPRK